MIKRFFSRINHINLKRATAAVVALTVAMVGLAGCNNESGSTTTTEEISTSSEEVPVRSYQEISDELSKDIDKDTTIKLWYKNQNDLDYLQGAATEFYNKYGIIVELKHYSGTGFLEDINRANGSDEESPDLFVISNYDIMRAALAGVAESNQYFEEEFILENYSETTLKALTYNENIIGYPLYFNTSIMLYDETQTVAPSTFDDILEFSNTLEYETNNNRVLMWELSEPFIDYLFVGAYSNLFGENGDDVESFDITNENAIKGATYYQNINVYLALDTIDGSYENVKQYIKDGNVVYTIVNSDITKEIDFASSKYKVCEIPRLNTELDSKSMSITSVACINSLSTKKQEANLFAAFLSYEYADKMLEVGGKHSARGTIDRTLEEENIIYSQYIDSLSAPKILEYGDFWANSQIAFEKIWQRQDVNQVLNELTDVIKEY